MFVDGYNPGVTHREIFTISPLLTFHSGAMDVRDHGVSTCDIVLKFGNDGAGFRDVVTNVGTCSMRASWRQRR